MSDYNIDLGERGVSSVPALMAKIVVIATQPCSPVNEMAQASFVEICQILH